MMIGFGFGFVIGAGYGISQIGEPFIRSEWGTPHALIFGLVTGITGAIICMPFGLAIGHEYTYISSSSLVNEYIRIDSLLDDQINSEKKYIKIEVSSINDKDFKYLTLMLEGEELRIPKRFVMRIDSTEAKTFITIPQKVFNLIKSKVRF